MATSTTTNTTTAAVTTKDMKSKQLYLSMPRIPPKVYLKTVNPHITCNLCKGYLIDATTIVECLHSFCHSCIMLHLRKETYCPNCEMLINKVKPNIKPDATLQAIVYKLVPGLYEKELLRRRAFYKLRTEEALQATPAQRGDDTEHLIFGPNESISLMLEYSDNDNTYRSSDDDNSNSSHEINSSDHCDDNLEIQLRKPKYLQCPAIFTISNLKKFLLHKFSINSAKFCVEIMYKVKTIALPDYYTLMDVAYIYTWKREAPMKFFYCVRAAHTPVTHIDQNAVIYDLQSSRFPVDTRQPSSSDSTDQEQSDADSDVRSDRVKVEPINGQISQEGSIDSTSNLSASTSTKPTGSSMLVTTTASVSSSSPAPKTEITKSVTSTSINGTERLKSEVLDKTISDETSSRPATSQRLDSKPSISIKTERLAGSPVKEMSDRRSNGASPKTTPKSNMANDIKSNVTQMPRPLESKESKEKVKTKSSTDNNATKFSGTPPQRNEPKTSTSSDMSMPLRLSFDSKIIPPFERNSRLLFNKNEKATSLSPPLSAENEYDFDQHLMKEQLSEKKKFLKSFHLRPCIPIPTSNDQPVVQLPKMPKSDSKADLSPTTNPSKDSKILLASSMATIRSPASSSSQSPTMKRPEVKASKRKSREPVKNIAKVRNVLPANDTQKWDASKAAGSTTTVSSSTSSPGSSISSNLNLRTATVNTSLSNTNSASKSKVNDPHASISKILEMSQQNKNNLRMMHAASTSSLAKSGPSPLPSTPNALATKSVFKTPPPTSSNSKDNHKQSQSQNTESETSIIINNVQRPHQADTPRPSVAFKASPSSSSPSSSGTTSGSPVHQFYFPQHLNRNFSSETEIQEIRNDDASKMKVYGPTMNLTKPFDSPLPRELLLPPMQNTFIGGLMNHVPFNFPLSYQVNPALMAIQHMQALQTNNLALKSMNRNKKAIMNSSGSSGSGKSTSNSSAHVNSHQKTNAASKSLQPARSIDSKESPKNVQSLLTSCKIPPSLSITLTNDETESMNRSIFNNKNTNVVNSIEIVKLTDEISGESNTRFATPVATSSPSNLMQTIEKETTRTSSPAAVNLSNNHNETYQTKFLQSLSTNSEAVDNLLKLKQKPKLGRPPIHPTNPSNARTNITITDAQKRKTTELLDRNDVKIRKLQPQKTPSAASSAAPLRPVPDLIARNLDDRRPTAKAPTSTTSGTGTSNASSDKPPIPSATDKAVAISAKLQANKDIATPKYQPLQTSSVPIWANHSTPDQLASHKALFENLSQSKKNSSTFVD